MTIEITPEQHIIIMNALQEHAGSLYRFSAQYKEVLNKEAQKACIEEMNRVRQLQEHIGRPPVESSENLYEIRSLPTRVAIGGSALSALELAAQLPDLIKEHEAIIVYKYDKE
ncbi:MAG: hypothetical protein J6Y20_04905 [Lachnospiraceae bacterium]|nr:hypothetical protein [Kiritimatiellia bacterium]MBP5461446.1 hypothetical protein [Lachnospiraceae bacterium]